MKESVRGFLQSDDEKVELLEKRLSDQIKLEAASTNVNVDDDAGSVDDGDEDRVRLSAYIKRYTQNAERARDLLLEIMIRVRNSASPDEHPGWKFWSIPQDDLIDQVMARMVHR